MTTLTRSQAYTITIGFSVSGHRVMWRQQSRTARDLVKHGGAAVAISSICHLGIQEDFHYHTHLMNIIVPTSGWLYLCW